VTAEPPLVSVIVPNYNYARELALCLRAVQAQTYPAIEIVLVDDCSTDDSVAVAAALGIHAISTSANGGVCAARNLGVEHVRGEILFFLDSDVALLPDAVANAVELLLGAPRVGAVCGTYDRVPLTPGNLVREYRTLQHHHWWAASEGVITGFLVDGMCAVPTSVWAQVGPWSESLVHSVSLDVAGRLAACGYEVRLTSEVLGRHDDDATLRVALGKVFTRTRAHMPWFLRREQLAGSAGSPQSRVSVAAGLTLAALAAPLVTGRVASAALALVPFAVFLWLDRRTYRSVLAERGPSFGVFYVAMHFTVSVTIAAGVAAGIAQCLVSPSFRRMYEKASA
jgi:GT2 family glycosyltransferase